MTFQRYRDHRRLIGYLMSMVVTRAALTARVGFLVSMAAMRAALTTGAVYLISMVNIKVGLKSDESGKGAIMKPPLKKIKALLLVWRALILETRRKKRPISWIFHKSEAFICPDNGILQADKFPLRYNKQPVSSIQYPASSMTVNLAY
jgi:hypothetical protein